MESRGSQLSQQSKSSISISRRSCDQCRVRKIACDRGTPCSSCIPAHLTCTHSLVASNRPAPKQRVLISAQYEQKIDNIAEGIDGIKVLLRQLHTSKDNKGRNPDGEIVRSSPSDSVTVPQSLSSYHNETVWDHSAHIVDFVKSVVEEVDSNGLQPEAGRVFLSLKHVVQILEGQAIAPSLAFPKVKTDEQSSVSSMPPLDAALIVLRWAKDHEWYTRVSAMSYILPLQTFTDICQKVYFAVEEYSSIEFILANGYLYQIFSQFVLATKQQEYQHYSRVCRYNLDSAVSQLPLLLPAQMETIAALTLGAFNAIENAKATVAWTFISAAVDLCLRLGYHRFNSQYQQSQAQQAAQENLFWTVYKIEKGLSLRLGRSSNIRDTEITIWCHPKTSSRICLAKIQGNMYDQLYSPVGLSRDTSERARSAGDLALRLRALIDATHTEIDKLTAQPGNATTDPMQVVYRRCDLVCQFSCLALTLRAIPATVDVLDGVSDECVTVARDTLDMHRICMSEIRDLKEDVSQVTKYINCAIMQGPFAPFSIIFTRAVRLLDVTDLARLKLFAASLQDQTGSAGSITHPYRLYELLCQAAQLHFDWSVSVDTSLSSVDTQPVLLSDLEFLRTETDRDGATSRGMEPSGPQTHGLSDWYYSNQQIMSLFEDDTIFSP